MMSEKKQTENSENKTGEQSKETPPKQKSKSVLPVKKTNEVKKLKNKNNNGIVPKQVKRTSSADGRASKGNVSGSNVKGKASPAVSPRSKPNSSKEHGPRKKDMKTFVIPRMAKEKELLEEVSLDSNSFQKDLLPAIVQQYRDPASRTSFEYEKAFFVHNEKLNTEFQERRKELKEEGRSDRELAEQYSFLLVDNMDIAEVICTKGLHARWTGDAKERQLGRGEMGVYLNRYSDILSPGSLESGKEYILLVLKVLKGKMKAVPLTHYKEGIEPTPKFDSHVAKNIVVAANNRFQTFVSNQIYCYQFGELNMEERPKQVCPFAVVSFTYSEKKETSTNSSVFESQVSTVKNDATSSKADGSNGPKKPGPMSTGFATPITLWKGKLANHGKELCSASLVSSKLPFLPTELPRRLDLATALPISKVKNIMPTDISKHPKLCHLSRHHEVSAKGRYFTYAQMRSLGDKKAFSELFKCLKDNQVALHTKTTSNKQVYVLPPCSLIEELHVSKPSSKICILHILFVSNKTSYRKLSDAVIKSSAKDDDGPSLPVFGKPKGSDFRAQLGRLFQQENTFYIAENERKKPSTPARISPAARNSRTSSQETTADSSRSSMENTPVAVLKDSTNSYPSEAKSVPNLDPHNLNADIPVVMPFQSGRLEHVEGSFSPIEEEELPSKEEQKGTNNVSEPSLDRSTDMVTSNNSLGERENMPSQSLSFGHPPKPVRVFSKQSHLPEINHQLNQLLRTQEIIASTSSSAISTPPGEKDTVEDYQNKIRQLRSNLDSLLQERANLKQSQELEASLQSPQMSGRQLPSHLTHHTPSQHFIHHQSSHNSSFLPASNNEHEALSGGSQHSPQFARSKEKRSQIFSYLQDILSSPILRQQRNLATEEKHKKELDDHLSPAGLTLDSLRSILDRVQGQSSSVTDIPSYPLSMQHHEISIGPSTSMQPGPSHLGVSPTMSDVENNNKRMRDGDETSASKRQRTDDSNITMTKLASILSSVPKTANVPSTPQSPPPWETLSLVHKEIPPETPESPPPWDRCNDTSNQEEIGTGDQWSRNVVLKEDHSKQLTVTIKGQPIQRHMQEGSSDLYSLVKTVLHGVTRKMASAALRNENDFAPPTQQEVHLQELVLSTLHVQNPGNSQIQFGASRKVEEVARPLQENHNSSSSQRASPRSNNSPRPSSSVSTGSNHSESPTGKSQTNRSSIIEDGTSFLGDLTSEDGVSVDLLYYRKKGKNRHKSSSSNAKVPKHRSSDTEGESLVVKRRVASNLIFNTTLPPYMDHTNYSNKEDSNCVDFPEEDPIEMDDTQEYPISSTSWPALLDKSDNDFQETDDAKSKTDSTVDKLMDKESTSLVKSDITGIPDEEMLQSRSAFICLSDMSVSCSSSPDPEIEINVDYTTVEKMPCEDDKPPAPIEGCSERKGQLQMCFSGEAKMTDELKLKSESKLQSVQTDVSEEDQKEAVDATTVTEEERLEQSQILCQGDNISQVYNETMRLGSANIIMKDARMIKNESLNDTFLVPQDPHATFLNLSNQFESVKPQIPSKGQDKPGLATPKSNAISKDKVLSILFGTAIKSPVGEAFKCSASEDEFHSEDDNVDNKAKKQILEERFFQRQKCLETTFKMSEMIGSLLSQGENNAPSDGHATGTCCFFMPETDDKTLGPAKEIKDNNLDKQIEVEEKFKHDGTVDYSEVTTELGRDKQIEQPAEFANLCHLSKGSVVAGGSIGELVLPLRKSQLDQLGKREMGMEVVLEGGMENKFSVLSCEKNKTVLSRLDSQNGDHFVSGLSLKTDGLDMHGLKNKHVDCDSADLEDTDSTWKVDDDDKTVIYEGDEGEENELYISTPEIMKMLDEELSEHQDIHCQYKGGKLQKKNDGCKLEDELGEDGACESMIDQPTKLHSALWKRKSFLTLSSNEVEKVSSTSEDENGFVVDKNEIRGSGSALEQKHVEQKLQCGTLTHKTIPEPMNVNVGNLELSTPAGNNVLHLMNTGSPSEIGKVYSCDTNAGQEKQEGEKVHDNPKKQNEDSMARQSLPSDVTSAKEGNNLRQTCYPSARSSPNSPPTRGELNDLVHVLRSEIKKKLKEHTQKVVRGLIKIKGPKFGQEKTKLDGSGVCWREVIQIKKDRRKKMKFKRIKHRPKGQIKGQQRSRESQTTLQCLDDLASKLSKCYIGQEVGGTVRSVLSPTKSMEMPSFKHSSPLKDSTKPRCGNSPRTLPFKKDFTAFMFQRNVFGSFSPKECVNSPLQSSPWKFTLVKSGSGAHSYEVSTQKKRANDALQEATFVYEPEDKKENKQKHAKKTVSDVKKASPSSGFPKIAGAPILPSMSLDEDSKQSFPQGGNISRKQVSSPSLAQHNLPSVFGRQMNLTLDKQQWFGVNLPLSVPRHTHFLQTYWTLPYVRPFLVPAMNDKMMPHHPLFSCDKQVASLPVNPQNTVDKSTAPPASKPSQEIPSKANQTEGSPKPQGSGEVSRVGSLTNIINGSAKEQNEVETKPISPCHSISGGCQEKLKNESSLDVDNHLGNSHLAQSQQAQSFSKEVEQSSRMFQEGQENLVEWSLEHVTKESSLEKCEVVPTEVMDNTDLAGNEEVSDVDNCSELCLVDSERDGRSGCETGDSFPSSGSNKFQKVTAELKEDLIYISSDDASGIDAIEPEDTRLKPCHKIMNSSRCDLTRKTEIENKKPDEADCREEVVVDEKGGVSVEMKLHKSEVPPYGTSPSSLEMKSLEGKFETNEDRSMITVSEKVTMDSIHKPDEDVIVLNEKAVAPDGNIGIPDVHPVILDARGGENGTKRGDTITSKYSVHECGEMKKNEKESGKKKAVSKEQELLCGSNSNIVPEEIAESDEDDLLLSDGDHSANSDKVKISDLLAVEDDTLSVGDDISLEDLKSVVEDKRESCKSEVTNDLSAVSSEITKNNLSKDFFCQDKSALSSSQPSNSFLQNSIANKSHSVNANPNEDSVVGMNQAKTNLKKKKKVRQNESSGKKKASFSHLKSVKNQHNYGKPEKCKATVEGGLQVKCKDMRTPEQKPSKVRKLSGEEESPKLMSPFDGNNRLLGKGKTKKGGVKDNRKTDGRYPKKERQVSSHPKSPVNKSKRPLNNVHDSPCSKDVPCTKKHKTASRRTSPDEQAQKRVVVSSSPNTKRTKLSFLPDNNLIGFQIPKISSKGKDNLSKEQKVKGDSVKHLPCRTQIATLDPEKKTVKINLKNAVVELNRLKLDLKSKKKSEQKEVLQDQRKVNLSKGKESPVLGKIRLKHVQEESSSARSHPSGRDSAIGKSSKHVQLNKGSKQRIVSKTKEESISSSLSQNLSKDLLKRLGKKHSPGRADPSMNAALPLKSESSSSHRVVTVSKIEKRKHVATDKSKLNETSDTPLDSHNCRDSVLTSSHSKSTKSSEFYLEDMKPSSVQENYDFSSDDATPHTPARKFWRTNESKMSPDKEILSSFDKIGIPSTSDTWRIVDEVFPSPVVSEGCPSKKLTQDDKSKDSKASLDEVCEGGKEEEANPSSNIVGQPIPTICSLQASSFRYSGSRDADVVVQSSTSINSSESEFGSSTQKLTEARDCGTSGNHGNPSLQTSFVYLVDDACSDGKLSTVVAPDSQQQDRSFKHSNLLCEESSSESNDNSLSNQPVITFDAKEHHDHVKTEKIHPPTPCPAVSSSGDNLIECNSQEEKKEKTVMSKDESNSLALLPSSSQAKPLGQNETSLKGGQLRGEAHVAISQAKGVTGQTGKTLRPVSHPPMSSSGDGVVPDKLEERKEKIALPKEQGSNKKVLMSSKANSAVESKKTFKSKPLKEAKRFHPYIPHKIKSINLVHCKRLVVPRLEELMWNHTFISPKLKQTVPPVDIFSTPRTDPGRFSSIDQLHHQEKTLKNADEIEPQAVPGMVTDAKKNRVKTLDASLFKNAAATDDIQKLLELDEMVYPLKNDAENSQPLRAHSSIRYHPYT